MDGKIFNALSMRFCAYVAFKALPLMPTPQSRQEAIPWTMVFEHKHAISAHPCRHEVSGGLTVAAFKELIRTVSLFSALVQLSLHVEGMVLGLKSPPPFV